MPLIHPITRRDMFILAGILLLAAFMRWERPGLVDYRYDEALLSQLAIDWLQGAPLPNRGLIASVGIPQGPLMVYLMAIPYALEANPALATAFVGLLNVVVVGLLWMFAHRYLNPRVAILAALMYAVMPWAVMLSRKIWNPNMQPPFLLVGVLLAAYGFLENKRWAQLWALPFFYLQLQFHYGGLVMFALLAWLMWRGRKNIHLPTFLVSIVITLILALPFLSGLTQTDLDAAQNLVSGDGGGLTFSSDAVQVLYRFLTGNGVEVAFMQAPTATDFYAQMPPLFLWNATIILLLVGVVVAWWRYRFFAPLLMLWAFLTAIILTANIVQAHEHYFVLVIPALCILVAMGVEGLLFIMPDFAAQKQHRHTLSTTPPLHVWRGGGGVRLDLERGLGGEVGEKMMNNRFVFSIKELPHFALLGFFGVILLTQAIWWRNLLTYVDTHPTPYGANAPLHYLLTVREKLLPYSDVMIIGGEVNYSGSLIWKPMLYQTAECVRDVLIEGGEIAVFPAQPFAIVLPPNHAPYGMLELYETANPVTIPMRPGEGEYTLHFHESAPEWSATPITAIEAPLFENGVRLTGYYLSDNQLYLRWHIEENLAQHNTQYFAHFLDATGERSGQRDSSFYNIGYWCEGDTLITRADVQLPADIATLRVGMYTRIEERTVNINVLAADGNPIGTWVDIPIVR